MPTGDFSRQMLASPTWDGFPDTKEARTIARERGRGATRSARGAMALMTGACPQQPFPEKSEGVVRPQLGASQQRDAAADQGEPGRVAGFRAGKGGSKGESRGHSPCNAVWRRQRRCLTLRRRSFKAWRSSMVSCNLRLPPGSPLH
jgi:hypothetical protein